MLIKKIGKQGRWSQALLVFLLPFFLFFALRSFVIEPFVIPSESMLPNLMIHDHILVDKNIYGLRWPIGDGWLWKFHEPQRGDVVVFRYPENREVFFIKRLVGLPGDHITVQGMNVTVNGKLFALTPQFEDGLFTENNGEKDYTVAYYGDSDSMDEEEKSFVVPEKSYFVMGDNRYNSQDSRFWGYVPESLLIGKAQRIWMSCEETLESAPFICNPQTFRVGRFFQRIK